MAPPPRFNLFPCHVPRPLLPSSSLHSVCHRSPSFSATCPVHPCRQPMSSSCATASPRLLHLTWTESQTTLRSVVVRLVNVCSAIQDTSVPLSMRCVHCAIKCYARPTSSTRADPSSRQSPTSPRSVATSPTPTCWVCQSLRRTLRQHSLQTCFALRTWPPSASPRTPSASLADTHEQRHPVCCHAFSPSSHSRRCAYHSGQSQGNGQGAGSHAKPRDVITE